MEEKNGKIGKYYISALLDTGAAVNILSARTYFAMDEQSRMPLRQTSMNLFGAGGNSLHIFGEIDFVLEIEATPYTVNAIVCDVLENQAIWGVPFLVQNDCQLDLRECSIQTCKQSHAMHTYHTVDGLRLQVAEPTRLEDGEAAPVLVTDPRAPTERARVTSLSEGSYWNSHIELLCSLGLIPASKNVLVTADGWALPLINLAGEPVTLLPGTTLGFLSQEKATAACLLIYPITDTFSNHFSPCSGLQTDGSCRRPTVCHLSDKPHTVFSKADSCHVESRSPASPAATCADGSCRQTTVRHLSDKSYTAFPTICQIGGTSLMPQPATYAPLFSEDDLFPEHLSALLDRSIQHMEDEDDMYAVHALLLRNADVFMKTDGLCFLKVIQHEIFRK